MLFSGFEAILYAAAEENLLPDAVMFPCDAHMSSNLSVTDVSIYFI